MNQTYHKNSGLYSSGTTVVSSNYNSGHINFTPKQALKHFFKQKVDENMLFYLVKLTEKIINVQEPTKSEILGGFHSLYEFIKALVKGSNVQTPTLMSTTIYLRRLSKILPKNVIGISTTRHRMFVGCLIITSKNLNDSSPLNKHWKNYCLDMLSLKELNTIEREILELFNWKLEFDESELIESLGELLMPQINFKYNSTTPSNSYLSAYSTNSSNSLFSGSQKTMVMSSRVSNLSTLTDSDYEQLYYKQRHQNTHAFYKQNTSKSDSNLLDEKPINNVFKHNPTPPLNLGSTSDDKNILMNRHLSNSDSLLNVSRMLNNRDQQRMMSNNKNKIPENNYLPTSDAHYRIQHPHFQMEYL